ncbi:DUF397 domain-containing protein [Marinitenerispora sediminis]|uniref:DUF397 domain-containing protein n=1 Tax=Marinitenerispora sediminis TaxID=1931232 RepID=A0A368T2S3_9ACTN|nr:DUF397 domain-containing protein [Marinitenerispora sediminis]RCV52186.1 DUF397 domain-containing protein [Marinitenerispora sediminis]RCV53097.1 DUF397 domain-containing protein [Marinitenerispora sediminis]RCV56228.1 DUF397 domain-containing protein [Marinitenerispora sediminis]
MFGSSKLVWRKSSYSNAGGNCVEAAALPGRHAVRDSTHPHGAQLRFALSEWNAFLGAVKADKL